MNIPTISKAQAIAAYGGNAAALARALNVTPSAIYQWPDGPIAEGYALKLRFVLRPEVFGNIPAANDDTPPQGPSPVAGAV
ncbi:Cro/CI family transcriptional regulator [Luteimonas sp. MJ293]|uniref:Cro/CI family transcriptional regulator n=1 Tax=Luteimonas sp. MJ146 TaxID=3129240 RepID=UPI0031BA8B34